MPTFGESILNATHNAQIIASLQAHNHQVNQPAFSVAQMACGVMLHILVLLNQLLNVGTCLGTDSRKLIEHLGDRGG